MVAGSSEVGQEVGCGRTREVEDDPRIFGVEEWSCRKLRRGQLIKAQVWGWRKDLECSLGHVDFEVPFQRLAVSQVVDTHGWSSGEMMVGDLNLGAYGWF